jgi:hypothetical protein
VKGKRFRRGRRRHPRGIRGSSKLNVPFVEIRRGGKVNLLPRTVVVGSVCIIEFLLVALIGFGI